jgi:hypothetical protein
MKRGRSPIRLVKRYADEAATRRNPARGEHRLAFDQPLYHWVCDEDRVRGAEFVSRKDPTKIMILHRATRPGVKWQVSTFDAEGAVGDVTGSSCAKVLNDVVSWRQNKIKSVETLRGSSRRRRRR